MCKQGVGTTVTDYALTAPVLGLQQLGPLCAVGTLSAPHTGPTTQPQCLVLAEDAHHAH